MDIDCPRCDSPLIHGGDHDIQDDEGEGIVSNLSCPECPVFVLVYFYNEEY